MTASPARDRRAPRAALYDDAFVRCAELPMELESNAGMVARAEAPLSGERFEAGLGHAQLRQRLAQCGRISPPGTERALDQGRVSLSALPTLRHRERV